MGKKKLLLKFLVLLFILALPAFTLASTGGGSGGSGLVTTHTYAVGTQPHGIAIDASGNVWVANSGDRGTAGTAAGDSNVTELNGSTGATIGTYVAGRAPFAVAIDASGNVWVTNVDNTVGTASDYSNVTVLSPTGATIGTYGAGRFPRAVAIDDSGNVWVVNPGNGTVVGTASRYDSNVTELSPTGATIGTYVAGNNPEGIAIDASGNVWVVNSGDSTVTELAGAATGVKTPLVKQLK